MGSSGDRLPAAVVRSTPSGIVVRFISDGGDEAGLTIDIVSDFHEAVIREQHMVGAFNTVVLGTLLLAVVVSVFLVVHLPLEVVLHHNKKRVSKIVSAQHSSAAATHTVAQIYK